MGDGGSALKEPGTRLACVFVRRSGSGQWRRNEDNPAFWRGERIETDHDPRRPRRILCRGTPCRHQTLIAGFPLERRSAVSSNGSR